MNDLIELDHKWLTARLGNDVNPGRYATEVYPLARRGLASKLQASNNLGGFMSLTDCDIYDALKPFGYEYFISSTRIPGPGNLIVVFAAEGDIMTACLGPSNKVLWVLSAACSEEGDAHAAQKIYNRALDLFRISPEHMEPIPTGIYYSAQTNNFHRVEPPQGGMGQAFFDKWQHRVLEFPQSAGDAS